MDDFIYILLLIAWVAFAFYRRSRQKQAARQPMQEPPRQAPDQPSQPSWEEILFGKGNEELKRQKEEEFTSPEGEPVISEIDHPDSQEGVSLEKMFGKMETIPPKDKKEEKGKPEEEMTGKGIRSKVRSGELDDFDLRQAVIYSEILNRPYE